MTVGEMRQLLETLPDHAQLCYNEGNEKGTLLETT